LNSFKRLVLEENMPTPITIMIQPGQMHLKLFIDFIRMAKESIDKGANKNVNFRSGQNLTQFLNKCKKKFKKEDKKPRFTHKTQKNKETFQKKFYKFTRTKAALH
jgi:hypothetical protein